MGMCMHIAPCMNMVYSQQWEDSFLMHGLTFSVQSSLHDTMRWPPFSKAAPQTVDVCPSPGPACGGLQTLRDTVKAVSMLYCRILRSHINRRGALSFCAKQHCRVSYLRESAHRPIHHQTPSTASCCHRSCRIPEFRHLGAIPQPSHPAVHVYAMLRQLPCPKVVLVSFGSNSGSANRVRMLMLPCRLPHAKCFS